MRECQTSYPMTTTSGAPGTSSDASSRRPRRGAVRRRWNVEAVTADPWTGAARPSSSIRFQNPRCAAPRVSKDSRDSRQASRSCRATPARHPLCVSRFSRATTRAPSSKGRGASKARTRWKGIMLAGIPMASAKTDTSVRAGCRRSMRRPSFTSSQEALDRADSGPRQAGAGREGVEDVPSTRQPGGYPPLHVPCVGLVQVPEDEGRLGATHEESGEDAEEPRRRGSVVPGVHPTSFRTSTGRMRRARSSGGRHASIPIANVAAAVPARSVGRLTE